MTQFSIVLRTAIEQSGLSQEELAARMEGGSQSSLSRFLTGDLPKKSMLEQICRQFPRHVCQALTKAYLVDLIPESAEDLVAVSSVQEEGVSKDEYRVGRVPVGSILWQDLETLGRAALRKPNLAKMLNYFASLERGEDPHPDYYESEGPDRIEESPGYRAAKTKLADAGKKRGRKKK